MLLAVWKSLFVQDAFFVVEFVVVVVVVGWAFSFM